jgi:holo-[acyl-carrier protein] synthase
LGIDLVEVERAERILARHGDRALRRFLLPAERSYVGSMANPGRHFAARLAAKEAVYKALSPLRGSTSVTWRDIEVVRDRRGRPAVEVHGRAAAVLEVLGKYTVLLSLTHTGGVAAAVAVIETVPSQA